MTKHYMKTDDGWTWCGKQVSLEESAERSDEVTCQECHFNVVGAEVVCLHKAE